MLHIREQGEEKHIELSLIAFVNNEQTADTTCINRLHVERDLFKNVCDEVRDSFRPVEKGGQMF